MNPELWKLFNNYQRKRDLQMSGVQKTLTKVAAATSKLNELCVTRKCDRKTSLQITADIIAVLVMLTMIFPLKDLLYVHFSSLSINLYVHLQGR